MFKKLLESLDAISSSAPKKANESKYPWLDHKDRPGAKKDEPKKSSNPANYADDSDDEDEEHARGTNKARKRNPDFANESKEAVKEAVTLSADGDEAMELINGMRKLAGMSPVAGSLSPVPAAAPVAAAPVEPAPAPVAVTPEPAPPVSNAEQTTAAFASLPSDSWDDDGADSGDEEEADDNEQMVVGGEADDDEDDDEEVKEAGDSSIYANSPDEATQDASAVTAGGDDMHKKKSSYPATAGGDNPMKAFEGKFKAIMADLLKE